MDDHPRGAEMRIFSNREDAGRLLAEALGRLAGEDIVVLGLPRGGVPVAYQVARALGAPLDILVVRKLGVPYQPELAMGAIGEEGTRVLNERVLEAARVSPADLAEVERQERSELQRRAELFRGDRPAISLTGRTALVIDDGIATGSTAAAACRVARARGARRVIVATPVAPPGTVSMLSDVADEVIALQTPTDFFAIGEWYADFFPTSDDEVRGLLAAAEGKV